MDYKDYQAGMSKDYFWLKGKNQLINVLLNKVLRNREFKILNVGVGTGEDLLVMKKFGKIYAIDVDPDALDLIPEALIFEKRLGDVRSMPYANDFFDCVVAFDVLEHIEDDVAAINEIHRVLNPNGFFIFTLPAYNFLYSSHDRALGHFRRYNKATIQNHLSDFLRLELGYWLFLIFLPVVVQKLLRRKEPISEIHYISLPKFINDILYSLLQVENWLIKHRITFPIGTTIYGIYQSQKYLQYQGFCSLRGAIK